jgi:hypothetical protein
MSGAKINNSFSLLYLLASGQVSESAQRPYIRLIIVYNRLTREPFDRHLRYLPALHGSCFNDLPPQARDRHDPVLAVTLLLPIIADQTHKISHPVLQSRPGRSRTVF